jgi:hypothetical protein
VDHACGKIFNFPQYSTNASETVRSTQRLASMARDDGITIKSFHADNGIFAKSEFKDYCERNRIKFSFCGVGAKHQNGVAEQNIKTVAQWARVNMLHLAAHWPQYSSSTFWPQAIDYAVWIFNRMPTMTTGIFQTSYGPPSEVIWVLNSRERMYLAVLFMCSMPHFKMARRSQNGNLTHVLVSF